MDKKRILIVCKSFHPSIAPRAFRATELAKEFARQGHDVTVCFPTEGKDYSSFEKEHNLKIKNLGELKWKEINLKGRRIELVMRRAVRRGLQLLVEWPDIELMFKVSRMLINVKEYDLLISIAVPFPIHWGVAKARTKENKIAQIWVADCGDPYMGCETDSYKKLFYFKFIEKWFSRKCDYISVPFNALIKKFYAEFHHKIVVIQQGFRTEDIELAEKVNNRVPTFAFAGSVIPGFRDLNLFFEFLKGIPEEFKFIIYTQQADYFKQFKTYFKEQLEIHEYLPRLELLYELSKCDFLINVDTIFDGQSLNTAFPSKLIDYSFTKRPILNICSNLLDKATILDFFSGNYKNRRRINNENYKIENVTLKFLRLAHFDNDQN
jgi:hypothetical protein